MKILQAGALYFAVVFGAGFVLGPIRILWLVSRIGARWAELAETPIMLTVIVVAARSIVRRLAVPFTRGNRLGMGAIALGLLLVAEAILVTQLFGWRIVDYIASRDPVSGPVYYLSLAVFAMMPLLVERR